MCNRHFKLNISKTELLIFSPCPNLLFSSSLFLSQQTLKPKALVSSMLLLYLNNHHQIMSANPTVLPSVSSLPLFSTNLHHLHAIIYSFLGDLKCYFHSSWYPLQHIAQFLASMDTQCCYLYTNFLSELNAQESDPKDQS